MTLVAQKNDQPLPEDATALGEGTEYIPQLLARLLASLHANGALELAQLGLNISGCRVLVALLRQGAMRVSRLADLVGLEATALSHLMRALEQRGLIARERQLDDHRVVVVSLTTQGRASARVCDELYGRTESSLLRDLPESEVRLLRSLLERMLANAGGVRVGG